MLDGGHSFGPSGEKREFCPSAASAGVPPGPVTARPPFPDGWRIVLAIPRSGHMVGGAPEADHFRKHCPVPIDEVQRICHEVVVRLLPGVAGGDLTLFSSGVNELQELGFKRLEIDLLVPAVRAVIAGLRSAGAACAELSSFGPTVYAVTGRDPAGLARFAEELLAEDGDVIVIGGRNRGARF